VGPTKATQFYFELRPIIDGVDPIRGNPGPIVSHVSELFPSGEVGECSQPLNTYFDGSFIRSAMNSVGIQANGFIRYADIFGHRYFVEFTSVSDMASEQFRLTVREDREGEE
jgi:hypothetical protein